MVTVLSFIGIFLIVGVSLMVIHSTRSRVVAEDSAAIAADRDGFVRRVLPAGRHVLRPFEHIALTVETKTKLASGRANEISTSDGILIKIHWSGTYAARPNLIPADETRSQRLRNLPNAEKGIARNVDILLRKLVGNYSMRDLFNPPTRERIERQLSLLLVEKLKPLGIAFNSLNLQAIELPSEVSEALNKAKALETLDGAIRHLDPTTREVVRGAYHLDEILHWEQILPLPPRITTRKFARQAMRQ